MKKSIGGEFQIDPSIFITENVKPSTSRFFASGRDAFRAILRSIRSNSYPYIYLPSYICETISMTAMQEGFKIFWYELNNYLHVDFIDTQLNNKKCNLILVVDYFGMLDLSKDIAELHSRGFTVILDKVQALYEESNFGADYWFFGFRKFLAIPEGAVAHSREQAFLPPDNVNSWSLLKIFGGIAKYIASEIEMNDEAYLKLFRQAETILDQAKEIYSTSVLFNYLYSRTEMDKLRQVRENNYKILIDLLKQRNIDPFLVSERESAAPLAVPIMIKNRDKVKSFLMKKKIYLPIHWKATNTSKLALFAEKYELSLVIDHRYSSNDMERLADELYNLRVEIVKYVV